MTRRAAVTAAAASALAFSGPGHAAECNDPDALTFAMVPTEETVAELELYKPVTDRMAELTGKKIQFFMPTSYASVVEGMLGGFVHVAVLGPYSYVIASEKDPAIEVFATYAKKPGHMQEEGPGYRAALITKKGSGFTTIESLKGTTLGLVDPGSTSGNLMPRVVFGNVIGMDLDDYFGKVVYTGSHELSSVAVGKGKVDAHPLHQQARGADRRERPLPRPRGDAAARARPARASPQHRHDLPGVQPHRPHERHGQRVVRAGTRETSAPCSAPFRAPTSSMRCSCCIGWVWRITSTSAPTSFRAGSASGSASPGR